MYGIFLPLYRTIQDWIVIKEKIVTEFCYHTDFFSFLIFVQTIRESSALSEEQIFVTDNAAFHNKL